MCPLAHHRPLERTFHSTFMCLQEDKGGLFATNAAAVLPFVRATPAWTVFLAVMRMRNPNRLHLQLDFLCVEFSRYCCWEIASSIVSNLPNLTTMWAMRWEDTLRSGCLFHRPSKSQRSQDSLWQARIFTLKLLTRVQNTMRCIVEVGDGAHFACKLSFFGCR